MNWDKIRALAAPEAEAGAVVEAGNELQQGEVGKVEVPAVVEVLAKPEAEIEAEGEKEILAGEVAPKPVKQDWREARIAQLTAKLAEARAAKPAPAPEVDPGLAADPEDRKRAVAEEATRQRQVEKFNEECGTAAALGKETYGDKDFTDRVSELTKLVDRTDMSSQIAYNQFLMAALATGQAHKIIFALGGDLDEAARIMAMNPTKMTVELTKMSMKEAPAASRLPKPITPVGGKAAAHTSIDPTDPERADHLSTAQWMARREAQIKAGPRH